MCLIVKQTGDDWRQENPNAKTIKVYKVLVARAENELETPFTNKIIKRGDIIKRHREVSLTVGDRVTLGAVHACYDPIAAIVTYHKVYRNLWEYSILLLELEIPVEDILAIGCEGDVALTQLTVPTHIDDSYSQIIRQFQQKHVTIVETAGN